MKELEKYKKALKKISRYGVKPDGETELQRIKRLKSIADKALFIANVIDTPVCDEPNKPTENQKEERKELIINFLEMNNWLGLEDEENARGIVDCYFQILDKFPTPVNKEMILL